MNSIPIKPKFILRVSAQHAGPVWPLQSRDFPEIDRRIGESYYGDEDDSSCQFEVTDMEDLLALLQFYQTHGKGVRFSIGVFIEAGEFHANANLQEKFERGICGSFKSTQKSDLSPDEAATKLTAIAHSPQRWQKAQEKGGAE